MNTLKTSLFTLLLFIISFNTTGQTAEKEYKASMDGWEVDLNKAYELSKKSGKPILANFTGSDWCGWCIKLKKSVFVTEEFKKWAKENVILLELDFPKTFRLPENLSQQNQGLAQAFGVRGYPTIWVFEMTANSETGKNEIKALATTGYVAGGAKAWIKDIESKLEQSKAAN